MEINYVLACINIFLYEDIDVCPRQYLKLLFYEHRVKELSEISENRVNCFMDVIIKKSLDQGCRGINKL
jgi:hypothetical protein